ncbi:MAG: cysteine hydrolase [Planctomycetota bacterium]
MNSVLLIIDMQEDFFRHERLKNHRAKLTHCTNELAEICRAGDSHIIWVTQEFMPDLSDASREVRAKGIHIVVAGTPGASLLPELKAGLSDTYVVKKRYSAFFGTHLDKLFARLKPDRLLIAGINTHACVRSTVVDAYQRDYEIILASECIDSHDAEHHEISWRYMEGKLGTAMSNAQVRSLLASDAG